MPLYTTDEIHINAPATKVWEALINPELTKKYMFGCKVECNWNLGDHIQWKGAQDGIIYVKGNLVSFEPGKEFAFTVFDPTASYADIPENYLTASYKLYPDGATTHLEVTQGDYASVEEGNRRYQDTVNQGGWSGVLEAIKELVESTDNKNHII